MIPLRFIGEPIEVGYNQPPLLEKKPACPDSFTWREQTFTITEVLEAWVNYERRGRMARNMQPQHAAVAAKRGSWGVGRFHFRVRTQSGEVYELYYDRSPKDVDSRKGSWTLVAEFQADEPL